MRSVCVKNEMQNKHEYPLRLATNALNDDIKMQKGGWNMLMWYEAV